MGLFEVAGKSNRSNRKKSEDTQNNSDHGGADAKQSLWQAPASPFARQHLAPVILLSAAIDPPLPVVDLYHLGDCNPCLSTQRRLDDIQYVRLPSSTVSSSDADIGAIFAISPPPPPLFDFLDGYGVGVGINGGDREEDPRIWVPQTDRLSFRPLCFCTSQGYYINLLKFKGGGVLGRHQHFSPVHALTLKGSWRYIEHNWQAKPGTYVFKPPGETHTLVVDDGCDESVPYTSADHAIAAASMSFTEASFSSMWCELLMALDNTRSSFSSDMQRGLPVCCKPSDQPRDAARREECSDWMKRV